MPEVIRVLHVDDEPSVSELIATFLEQENYQFSVETATSANEGLDCIRHRPPDCVVSDYNMPNMDGLEFLKAVREEFPELPFILYTGKGSEAVASEAIAADVTDYLQKEGGTDHYELLANRIRNAVQARREAKRAERQEELMRLTEFAGDTAGFELDAETEEIHLNDGVNDLIDVPAQSDLSLEEMVDLFHPEDREDIRQNIDRARQTDQQTHGTWRFQPDEDEQQLLDVTFTSASTNNDATTIRGALHDATDRWERQRELEQVNTVLKTIVDNLPMGVLVENTEREVLMANEQLGETLGVPLDSDDLVGRDCATAAEELQGLFTDPEKFRDGIREAIQRREPTYHKNLHLEDGRTLEREYVPYTLPDGEANLWLYYDVTERKERERELTRYETIIEGMDDVALILDTDKMITFVNERITKVLGIPPEDLIGEDFLKPLQMGDIAPADQLDELETIIDRILQGQQDLGYTELPLDLPIGNTVIGLRASPITQDGQITGLVGVARNITDRKEREQKLSRQAEELERQNDRLEEFTNVVSHDLQNPLGVAETYLEMAAENSESEYLTQAADAIDRSQALIDDLLTLAQQGEAIEETEAIDLATVADWSWEMVETPEATLDTSDLGTVEADASRLQQLLENLYRNAIEHGGETVNVATGPMDGGFYVSDNGPGIPEAERADIFETGYSTGEDGNGFGLRIVEQIAAAHEWEIAVAESEEGGARFEFTGVEIVN